MSKNKCHKGRYIEKVGYWIPNKRVTVDRAIVYNKHRLYYWLSVGAQPTEKVHKLLAKVGILPKLPVPFGSQTLYSKPEKSYPLQYFHKNRWGLNKMKEMDDYFYLKKINDMRSILEKKNNLDKEALNE